MTKTLHNARHLQQLFIINAAGYMIPQVKWFERSFNFDFPVSMFPVIFSRMEGSIFRLYHLLANADESTTSVRQQGWSVKEHVGHLTDLEALWFLRLQDHLDGKETLSVADLTNATTENAGHNHKNLEELVDAFSIARQKTLEKIYFLDAPALSLTSIHPRLQKNMRLIDTLYFVAEHDDHHISAISNLLRQA